MSMSVHFYVGICRLSDVDDRPDTGKILHCEDKFVINSWAMWVLKEIEPHLIRPEIPIRAPWLHEDETYGVETLINCGIFLIEARNLKSVKFYENDWHETRIVHAKAVSAYLNALPDDWPVVVYYL